MGDVGGRGDGKQTPKQITPAKLYPEYSLFLRIDVVIRHLYLERSFKVNRLFK
jgi:hypothetical protein